MMSCMVHVAFWSWLRNVLVQSAKEDLYNIPNVQGIGVKLEKSLVRVVPE